jgi:1-deoxyxylulose-5-phosphate synthase
LLTTIACMMLPLLVDGYSLPSLRAGTPGRRALRWPHSTAQRRRGSVPDVEHTRLGRTGLQVSRLCLGTMTFGLQCDEPTAVAILDRAAEGGIDFLDSSDAYPLGGDISTRGRTEEILGRWLRGKRDRWIVATKCFAPTGPAPFDAGNSRKHIMDAVEASLRRLQTDYIDLYQLHGYDRNTPIEETLGALDDLVHQGKVRYVGCSNFLTYQLARAVGRTETLGLARLDSVQPRYNLLFREIEREMLPYCAEEGIGVIPYNPIAGGLLSGKHVRTSPPPEGTRFTLGWAGPAYQDRYWHERQFDTVDELRELAQQAGVSLVTLSVAWVLANKAITAPIVGASSPHQLDASLAATEYALEEGLKAKLDEVTYSYRLGDSAR